MNLVDAITFLNVVFPALHRVDTAILKLVKVKFGVIPDSSWVLTNGAGSSFNINADHQGYQYGKSKKKRRGGINRKKRGGFQHQVTPARDISNDFQDGPDDAAAFLVASPVDDVKPPKGLFVPVVPEAQPAITEVAAEAPILVPPQSAIGPISPAGNEYLSSADLESEERLPGRHPEASTPVNAGTTPLGETSEEPSRQNVDMNEPSAMIEEVPELPNLVIPPLEPRQSPPTQQGLFEVTKGDSFSPSQSALFLPVPVEATPPSLPASDPSLEPCPTLQSLPFSGLPEAATSSPVSSAAPTPSLQTPSPPYVAAEVVAAPIVQELEDDVIPASPVSLALQAVGVPTVVRPDRDTFSAHAKAAESFTEALRMVVSARQQLELQSREERVNPILMSNRIVAVRSLDDLAPSADTLVQEVLAGKRLQDTMQAFKSHVRESLVANMAARRETVDEKIVRLRGEYLTLHREWVARCAEMDNSHKVDPASGEVSAIPARTTRRSAAVLGDAVRSDLEMEQIIASLGNDELYDPAHLALRNLAVIPDMISVTRGKVDAVVDDTNNAVYDPQSFFDPSPGLAEWTDDEVEIFKQRFAKYPKQFGHVAVGLKHKTQAQCVQFYYLHKKVLIDFREAITTYGQSKRRRGGRKTDKKKGGLLADIRQHDAEVSKKRDPVKRKPAAAARRRRELTRVVSRRSITAAQQEEQTPVTTPTPEPEPESTRPKRRRNTRPVADPEPVGTEEPPPKRSRRPQRKPRSVPETATPEPTPPSKTTIEVEGANPIIGDIGENVSRVCRFIY